MYNLNLKKRLSALKRGKKIADKAELMMIQ